MTSYKGFLSYDATEVVNVARTMAYIKAGYGTPGMEFDTPVPYDGLDAALGETYRTPALDAAPWYDVDRPETHGFAGVLPIDFTGLDGTTATREVVENVGDGATAQKVRRGSRTVAASALLVGDSSEAVHAGLEWLTTVLYRQCGDTAHNAQLEGFTVLPSGFTGAEDTDAAMVDTAVDPDDAGWAGYGGTWHPGDETFMVEGLPGEPVGLLDGGLPWTTDSDVLDGDGGSDGDDEDGGTPGDDGPGEVDGGTPSGDSVFTGLADGGGVPATDPDFYADGGTITDPAPQPYARLVPPVELSCLSKVVVTWTVEAISGSPAPAVVQVGAVDSLGRELYRDGTYHPIDAGDAPTVLAWTWEHAEWDAWWPALWVSAPGVHVTVSVSRRPLLSPEACLSPLRRSWGATTTVAGPTIVSDYADDCDNKLLQVEWTWVCGDPYRYGDPTDLVVGLPGTVDAAPTSNADAVGYDYLGTVTAASTACAEPTDPPSCAYDPDYPGFVAPPTAPVIADPGAVVHTNYKRSLLTIDPGVLPAHGVVATQWRFENTGAAKHGVRVRLWAQDDPDFATHTECGFTDEFTMNYIDNGAILVIDGVAGQVLALCEDGSLAPAGGVMRGPYGTSFAFPTIACGGRYFITVDTGATEGTLEWSLAVAPREG